MEIHFELFNGFDGNVDDVCTSVYPQVIRRVHNTLLGVKRKSLLKAETRFSTNNCWCKTFVWNFQLKAFGVSITTAEIKSFRVKALGKLKKPCWSFSLLFAVHDRELISRASVTFVMKTLVVRSRSARSHFAHLPSTVHVLRDLWAINVKSRRKHSFVRESLRSLRGLSSRWIIF